jgi:hypothetical protein
VNITTEWLESAGCRIVCSGKLTEPIEWAYYTDGTISAFRHRFKYGKGAMWFLRPRSWGGKPRFRVKAKSIP